MINTVSGLKVFEDAMKQIFNPPRGVELRDWPLFNELVGGLRPKEFTIFCGATGAGKTQFLANVAAQLITLKEKVFVAPVETGYIDFAIRVLSVLSKKDLNTGRQFKLSDCSGAVNTHMNELNENIIFSTHDNRVEIMEMIETLRYQAEVNKVSVAVLDNLNFFLKPTGQNNIVMEYDEAIHSFVMLAKQIPMHIILVMHPKKNEGKLKSEFDIKGSSTAVQEAQNVLFMNRLDEDEIPSKGTTFTRELVYKKIRRRGFNVNKKVYMDYVGGAYVERRMG